MKKRNIFQRSLPLAIVAAALLLSCQACFNSHSNDVTEIALHPVGQNALKVKVAVQCTDTVDAAVKYWPKGKPDMATTTPVSAHKIAHNIVITNLQPARDYEYQVFTGQATDLKGSRTYSFRTNQLPIWLQENFLVVCPDSSKVPAAFRTGYVMVTKRDDPGVLCVINTKGEIVWYHQVSGTGFKVARFTENNTFLTLLGGPKYETSYGDEILEVSLTGDTLLDLKKGQQDFRQTIHHEILENKDRQLITLCVEERVMDLSSKGGGKKDTVKGDGILVLDRQGKQIWNWTVFDELNPLNEKNINKEKSDWMHANCIAIDKDGNYLISFYNNGQIWKIDAHTGKRLWTFGKNGDFPLPEEAYFDQAHGVHINQRGSLMFFDNGVSKKTSRTLAFDLDEKNHTAKMVINTKLPRENFNERMGSSYLIDTALLACTTKRNAVVLTSESGIFLWLLRMSMTSYRADFIPAARMLPYVNQSAYTN